VPSPTSLIQATQSRALVGIGFKLCSVAVFLAMSSLLKAADGVPPGEMVFFRSLFAIIPIVIFLAWRRELREGSKTNRPGGHLLRGIIGVVGQGLGFYALTQLPLAEATALNYTLPLLTVITGALFLHEEVRLYRWSAVVVGLVGVAIIIWPRLTVFEGGVPPGAANPAFGAIAAIVSCCFASVAFLQIRRLVSTERSATIVLFYSITCSLLALLTLPFGWVMPSPGHAALLIGAGICGGIGQVTLTESFRHADMSVVAPFEYTSLVLSIAVGFFVFGDVPTVTMIAGSVILVAAGVFIIYREHRLGLARRKARENLTPQG
jgi:drug/metabolite transporter (DMT)-like permease